MGPGFKSQHPHLVFINEFIDQTPIASGLQKIRLRSGGFMSNAGEFQVTGTFFETDSSPFASVGGYTYDAEGNELTCPDVDPTSGAVVGPANAVAKLPPQCCYTNRRAIVVDATNYVLGSPSSEFVTNCWPVPRTLITKTVLPRRINKARYR